MAVQAVTTLQEASFGYEPFRDLQETYIGSQSVELCFDLIFDW